MRSVIRVVALLAVVTAGSMIALIDTGMGPGLISNGLAFLSFFMLFVPRGARWNRQYLGTAGRRAAMVAN